ncbi:MAG: B12-binding domain-containing radical SAM protein [Deltaproteobacteria bacterium]|nr:B12-binding domain-containing radical SAM protein [Deltaproteobacteria bacterium]
MSRIAIVKVRSEHDLEWNPGSTAKTVLKALGARDFLKRMQRTSGMSFMPQLTLPYLAALGRQYNEVHGKEHRFELVDEPPERIDMDGYDMAWLTCGTPQAKATYRVADRARRQGVITVLGGIHASMLPEEAAGHADSLVMGEGEDIIAQILTDWDAGGKLKERYRGTRRSHLAGLPVPQWRAALVDDYCPWVVPVQTSRGCRNACSFCSTTRYQGAQRRHRPVEDIVAEIRLLQKSGVLTPGKTVFFTDNNIVWDTDHRRGNKDSSYSRELFEALIPLNIDWVGQGEIGVSEEPSLVRLMAESGCFLLLVGLESLSQTNLTSMGKPCNTVALYEEWIDFLHRHGVGIIGCFMFGLEYDTPETFEVTEKFIHKWVDVPQISLLTPFPGTALYRKLKREHRLLHEDWSRYDITHVVFEPNKMRPEELDRLYQRIVAGVYNHPACLGRALRHAARRTVNGLPRMGRLSRFTSILAPNLIYARLARVGRARNMTDGAVPTGADMLSWLRGSRMDGEMSKVLY